MEDLIVLEDYDLVAMPDYIPEEYRSTYEFLDKAIECRITEIIATAKNEIGRRSEETVFMHALSDRILTDRNLNFLKKSLAEFKILCCHPRFLLKKKVWKQ